MSPTPMNCRCGTVQGAVDLEPAAGRARCYCQSCQTYASFLGNPQNVLDSQGGTEIIATLPSSVRLTAGVDELACVSVTEKGPLRWYAKCCRTPIGNTSRDPKIAYIGLIRACLAGPDALLEERFGPSMIALNTDAARGKVKSTPVATLLGGLRIIKMVVGARVSGRYKDNPFFLPGTSTAIKVPRPLTAAERSGPDKTT